MDRTALEDTCVRCFEQVVGLSARHGLDTGPGDMPEWSSLSQIYLIMALEREIGVEIDPTAFTFGATLRELCDQVTRATDA